MKIAHQDIVLEFDETTGAIVSGYFGGQRLLWPAKEFFSFGMRDRGGDLQILRSSDFDSALQDYIFCYRGRGKWSEITVKVLISKENGFIRFRPTIIGIPENCLLEWIDVPQLVTGNRGSVFWPHCEGVVVDNFKLKEENSPYRIGGFPNNLPGLFPGPCQMQFLSYFEDKSGLYFAAHDLAHQPKNINFEFDSEHGCVRLSLQTFTGGVRNYRSSFEYVIGTTTPDWYGGCEKYRVFISADPKLPDKNVDKGFMEQSPIVMIYPVRGEGDDRGAMKSNEYFPYSNAMPVVRKYAELLDSPIMSLLMHWEGTAPWAPPYVWPPYGGEEVLADYRDQLHAEGHFLGVYCSGYAWTQTSSITDYSMEDECRSKNLERFMIRGPHGELEASICTGPDKQRLGYDLCLGEEWGRKTVIDEIRKLADFGIDYAQYFDQNLGCASHLCYSGKHHHSPLPGADQVTLMETLLEEVTEDLKNQNKSMLLGSEAASSHPYMRYLPFCDCRFNFNYGLGTPVPGYAYVFHEYVHGFMGNQGGVTYRINCQESPDNLLYRTAYAFHAGDALSFVLKDNGLIHWGWIALHKLPEPEQEPVIRLLRNLNALRRKYPEVMLHGRMLRPQFKLTAEPYVMVMTNGNGTVVSYPGCFLSSWQCSDDKIISFVTNFQNKPMDIKLTAHNNVSFELHLAELTTVVLDENTAC